MDSEIHCRWHRISSECTESGFYSWTSTTVDINISLICMYINNSIRYSFQVKGQDNMEVSEFVPLFSIFYKFFDTNIMSTHPHYVCHVYSGMSQIQHIQEHALYNCVQVLKDSFFLGLKFSYEFLITSTSYINRCSIMCQMLIVGKKNMVIHNSKE